MAVKAAPSRFTGLLLALTFSSGAIDAVGYLGEHRVFLSNMTGNVLTLGMAAISSTRLTVLGPAIAVLGFLLGAVLAGRALAGQQQRWSGRTTLLLGATAAVVLGFGVALSGIWDAPRPEWFFVVAVVAIAMGAQAAVARSIRVTDLSTVVVTGTLTAFGSDLWTGAGGTRQWLIRGAAVLLLLAGATTGAVLVEGSSDGAALLLAGAVITAVTLLGERERRRAGSEVDQTG